MKKTYKNGQQRTHEFLVGLRVMRALCGSWWNIRELADHLGMNWRTLYRYVGSLRKAGVPIRSSTLEGGNFTVYHIDAKALADYLSGKAKP